MTFYDSVGCGPSSASWLLGSREEARERLLLVTAEAEVYNIEVRPARRRRFRLVAAAISGWQDRSLSWRELPEADLVQEALGFIAAPPLRPSTDTHVRAVDT